jgi:hypothetical protein
MFIHDHIWAYIDIGWYRQIGTVTAFLDLWKSSSWDLPATKHLRTASTLMLGVVCGIKIFAWRSEKALKEVKTWSPRHLILRCQPLAPGRWFKDLTALQILASWHCFEIRMTLTRVAPRCPEQLRRRPRPARGSQRSRRKCPWPAQRIQCLCNSLSTLEFRAIIMAAIGNGWSNWDQHAIGMVPYSRYW